MSVHSRRQATSGHSSSRHSSSGHAESPSDHAHGHAHPYLLLAAMAALSFLAMYILMYAMVDRFSNVYNNINQLYMAALMAAPMVAIELVLMRSMYPNASWNRAILVASVLVLVLSFLAIRAQTGVGDRQFLRSMIPHHASAVLMCEQGDFTDARLRDLCGQIVASQNREIAAMKALLDR